MIVLNAAFLFFFDLNDGYITWIFWMITPKIFSLNQTQPYIFEYILSTRMHWFTKVILTIPISKIYSHKSQLILLCHLIICLDHKSCAETGQELMRPYLHEFLTSAYEDYDIVIWCMWLVSSFFLATLLLMNSSYHRILCVIVHKNIFSNIQIAVCF